MFLKEYANIRIGLRNVVRLTAFCVLLSSLFVAFVFSFPVSASAKNKKPKFTVVIDAGHGGHDSGAVDNGITEKDINLGVALKLRDAIKKNLKDINVVMTRDDDTYLTLQQRADKANGAKGNLFISIHTNSVDKSNRNRTKVAGASVYALGLHKDNNNMAVARRENSVIELEKDFQQTYSGFDPSRDESYIIFEMAQKKNLSQSIRFADNVQKQLVSVAGRKDRGVHQAGFWVLWATSMPAVLVELDFICNPQSAEFMGSDKGREKMAQAIANAVKGYYDSVTMTSGVPSSVSESGKLSESDSPVVLPEIPESRRVAEPSSPETVMAQAGQQKVTDRSVAKRRRRSGRSKAVSDGRPVETASIPLHYDGERLAKVDTSSETQAEVKEKADRKSKDKKGKKKIKDKKHDRKVEKLKTVYKIQILASTEKLSGNSPRFAGLTPVAVFRENNLYKYTFGESEDKAEIELLLAKVRDRIPDAFVIKMKK